MIRRVSFIRRKPGLTRQAFLSHWTGRHAEIVRQLPGLRGLRFSRVDRCVPRKLSGTASARRGSTASPMPTAPSRPIRFAKCWSRIGRSSLATLIPCYIEEPSACRPSK